MLRNITLSAEERIIQKARDKAAAQHKSLNAIFREWLARYTRMEDHSQDFNQLMKRLSHVRAGRKYSRDEMNER